MYNVGLRNVTRTSSLQVQPHSVTREVASWRGDHRYVTRLFGATVRCTTEVDDARTVNHSAGQHSH